MSDPEAVICPTDYSAGAELYANRLGRKSNLFFRRFDTLAEALKFAVESLPSGLVKVAIDIGDRRIELEAIRTLYDGPEYPLKRAAAL